jgi:hypothetical protein
VLDVGQVNDIALNPRCNIIATANRSRATLRDVGTQQQIGAPLDFGIG